MDANYDAYTPERLKAEMLAKLAGYMEVREGSYANSLLSPAAYQIYKIYQMVPQVLLMAFPDGTSGEFIDKRAADFGLVRTDGSKATVTLRFTCRSSVVRPVIPAGTVAVTEDGLRFVTLESATFTGETVDVPAQAENIGRVYNVEAWTITGLAVSIGGVESVTNPEAASGGADRESDESLLERYHEHLQRPVSSGNKNHYIAWAKETSGIGSASVIPLWNGPGTVKVIVAGPDKRPVDSDVVDRCAAHIEEERPIGAQVTVVSAAALAIDVEATVTLVAGHTKEEVQADLEASLGALLAAMPFGVENLLRYSRCLALLLDCAGVEEYHVFQVNGATANITIQPEQTPQVGTVTITEQGG